MGRELVIEKVVFGADGMGRLEGKVCFVPGVITGEKVLVRILSEKKNFSRARLLHLIESSPERVNPPCPYVTKCGGCQYQHMNYAEELRTKERQVAETLGKALGLASEVFQPIEHGEKYYGYRTSITLHKTSEEETPQRLAFVGQDNESAVFVDECLLADKKLEVIFTQLHSLTRNETSRTFKLSESGEIISSDTEADYAVKVGSETLLTNAFGFFQNNLEVTSLVANHLKTWVEEAKPERFIDLYSGVGTFSLLAARKVPEIFCFEENPYSTKCLAENLKVPGAVYRGKVEEKFPEFVESRRRVAPQDDAEAKTMIFMDPPRQGITNTFASWLNRETPCKTLVYLACDPAILARDLKLITAGGKFVVKTVVPFDMFPRTKHIETLVLLKRFH